MPGFSRDELLDLVWRNDSFVEPRTVDVHLARLRAKFLAAGLPAPEIETVYVMASPEVSFVSSSGIKEIAAYGGNVDELVPQAVAKRLRLMYGDGRPGAPVPPSE